MLLLGNGQVPYLRLGSVIDVQMGEQGHAPVDHRADP
jgi:hypothetical protein